MSTTTEELWTLGDIAAYLKISTSTLYKNWKKLGIKPVVAYPGAKPRFPKAAVIKAVGMMKIIIFTLLISSQAFAQSLTASWYSVQSLKEEGTYKYSKGIMANGRKFSDFQFTCASRDWPLGTTLKVTRADTKTSVVVLVTDRINKRFKGKRIDLSLSAFSRLASLSKGLVKVEVEKI